jgi:hypothetical protein
MAAGTLVLAFLNGQVVACPPEQLGMTCHRDAHLPAGVLIGGGAVAAVGGGLVLILGRDSDTRRPASGATAWVVSARGSF